MENYWTGRNRLARRRLLQGMGVTGAAAAAYVLTGCGDDDKGSGTTPAGGATQAPGSTSAPGASPTPQDFLSSIPFDPPDPTPPAQFKMGGTFTRITDRALGFELYAPGATVNVSDTVVPVYSRIVRLSNQAGQKNISAPELERDLAQSWEQPDDSTFIFQLAPGIKWQNVPPLNGREFKVDDIKYMINRGQNHAKNSNKTDWLRVSSVDDVGGGKFRVRLNKPFAAMLQAMSSGYWAFVPPEIGGTDNVTTAQTAVGTGPFIVTKYTPNVEVVYKKNPDYFRKDELGRQLPYTDGFTLAFVTDPATRLALVEGGKADMHYALSSPLNFDNVESFAKRNPGKLVYQVTPPFMPTYHIAGHYTKAPWSDVRVRRALNMLMDRATIIKTIHHGLSQVGPMLAWPAALDKLPTLDDLGPNYKHDIAAAKQLLSAAGVAPGTELALSWYTALDNEAIVSLYQQAAAQAGIKINLNKKPDLITWLTEVNARSWQDLILQGSNANFPDVESFPAAFVTTASGNNSEVNDPELNKLYDQIQSAKGDARRAIHKQMWDRMLDQCIALPLPNAFFLDWTSARLHNWRQTPTLANSGFGNKDMIWLSA
jgi:ABC-type transport system substrate-binding protein